MVVNMDVNAGYSMASDASLFFKVIVINDGFETTINYLFG